MSETLGTINAKLTADTADFKNQMNAAKRSIQNLAEGFRAAGVAATAVFAGASLAISKFVSTASDANEQMNVIQTSFGKLTPAVEDWARKTGEAVGRSRLDLLDYAGTTQAMLAPMIGSQKAAAGMSTKIAQLAVDIGSFNNVADEEALVALKAGLIGSTEPMRRFGVVMTVAGMEAYALSKGIKASWKDMDEASKVALRYQFIMEKTKLQQGDAAKTADSFANMVKRIQGQFQDLSNDLGQSLLPIAEKVVHVVSDILKWFQQLSPAAKRFVAISIAIAGAMAGVVAAFSGIALLLPSIIAGFSAMAAVAWPVVAIGAALVAGIAGTILAVGMLRKAWDKNFLGMREKVKWLVDAHIEAWSLIKNIFKILLTDIAKAWDWTVNHLISQWNTFYTIVAKSVNFLLDAFEKLAAYGILKGVKLGRLDPQALQISGGSSDAATKIAEMFRDAAPKAMEFVKESWAEGLDTVKEAAAKLAEALGISVDEVKRKILDIPDLGDGPAGRGKGAKRDLLAEYAQQTESLASGDYSLAKNAKEMFRDFISGGKSAANALLDFGKNLGGALGAVFGVIDFMGQYSEDIQSIMDSIDKIVGDIVSAAGQVLKPFADALSSLTSFIFESSFTFEHALSNLAKKIGELGAEMVADAAEAYDKRMTMMTKSRVGKMQEALAAAEEELAETYEGFAGEELREVGVDTEAQSELKKAIKEFTLQIGILLGDVIEGINGTVIAKEVIDQVIDDIKKNMGGTISVERLQEIAKALDISDQVLAGFLEVAGVVVEGLDSMGDSLAKVNDELNNVPQGFKVFLRRFESIQDPSLTGGGVNIGGLAADQAGAATSRMNVYEMHFENVNVGDPEEFITKMEEVAEIKNVQQTGTPVATAPAQMIPSMSGQGR